MTLNKFAVNSFLALRKETLSAFSIVKVIDKTKRHNSIYSENSDELRDFKNDIFNEQLNELVKMTLTEKTKNQTDHDVNLQVVDKSAKSQDFFQDNNPVGKRYTTKRIKSRNVLSNIAYVGINKEDFYNKNFIFDVYLLVTKNLNPFSLDRKLGDKKQT